MLGLPALLGKLPARPGSLLRLEYIRQCDPMAPRKLCEIELWHVGDEGVQDRLHCHPNLLPPLRINRPPSGSDSHQ